MTLYPSEPCWRWRHTMGCIDIHHWTGNRLLRSSDVILSLLRCTDFLILSLTCAAAVTSTICFNGYRLNSGKSPQKVIETKSLLQENWLKTNKTSQQSDVRKSRMEDGGWAGSGLQVSKESEWNSATIVRRRSSVRSRTCSNRAFEASEGQTTNSQHVVLETSLGS